MEGLFSCALNCSYNVLLNCLAGFIFGARRCVTESLKLFFAHIYSDCEEGSQNVFAIMGGTCKFFSTSTAGSCRAANKCKVNFTSCADRRRSRAGKTQRNHKLAILSEPRSGVLYCFFSTIEKSVRSWEGAVTALPFSI
uniref:Uncharacterized protein n=1 Tax=Ixodes ricinus TaxID=34613 RepID=A0A6B0USY4_IXORI